jgi:outer membrane receptor protein involved in Fe transport
VSGAEAQGRATTDAGDLLRQSQSATGVETQRRSPIANQSYIRGFHLGQLVTEADNEFWFPARQDLDTFLSKIDSGTIKEVTVVKGPYSVLYGPGFAFIEIETVGSPRYEHGFEWHGITQLTYKTNGEAWYGRQTFMAGDEDWGARIAYGQRTAQGYITGDGFQEDAGYNTRDIDANFGVNLSKDIRLELAYIRLDQTDLGFPGQIFDTDFLVTNSYNATLVMDNQEYWDHFQINGFYNRTSLHGDAQHEAKRLQIPVLGPLNSFGQVVPAQGLMGQGTLGFLGTTNISQSTAGYRALASWGTDPHCNKITVGTDFRYMLGALDEFDNLFATQALPCFNNVNNPVPNNHHGTAGALFAEDVLPVSDCLTVKFGSRFDYVFTDIDNFPANVSCGTIDAELGRHTNFEREFALALGYGTFEYKVNHEWTLTGGMGYAERAPTPTELYAMGPFLAILQQGFTTVIGNPDLNNEKLYQVDLGLRANYEKVRLGVNGFYAFINDYITYAALNTAGFIPGTGGGTSILVPANIPGLNKALTVKFVNTPEATLSGFEAYGEVDATDWLTPFITASYVEGRDLTRDHRGNIVQTVDRNGNVVALPGVGALGAPQEPLPMIAPIESHIGIRFHEACKNPAYGIEFAARVVGPQNRVASSLEELRSPGFTTFDLRSYWQVRKGVLLTAGVENIFDRFYREHLDLRTGNGQGPFFSNTDQLLLGPGHGVYQPGTNAYVGVQLSY